MSIKLGSKERVLRSIEGRDIDRVPCFFRAEHEVVGTLMRKLRLKSPKEVEAHFGSDAIHTQTDADCSKFPNLKGIEKAEQVDSAPWPRGSETIDIQKAVKEAKDVRSTDLAVYGGVWTSVFTHSRQLIGEEKYLLSMVENPDLIDRIIHKLTDLYIEANEALFSQCAKDIDIFYFGSDIGTQQSMFFGLEMFRRFFKPSLKRLTAHAKGFGLKVMFHTCGAVSGIIDDLIECDIDILDPVQVSARGMKPSELAQKFKGRIAFHGGISTQSTLPFGEPQIVREEVFETIKTLGPLGYIVAPEQHLIGDIPLTNIEEMYDVVRSYQVD